MGWAAAAGGGGGVGVAAFEAQVLQESPPQREGGRAR